MDIMEILWRFGWLWSLVLSLLLSWFGWSLGKKFVTHKACETARQGDSKAREALEAVLEEHDRRVVEIVTELRAFPPPGETHNLSLQLERLRGEQRTMSVEVKGLRDILERVENHVNMIVRGHFKE